MMKSLLIALLTFCISFSYAQKPPFKVGKVSEEEIKMSECSFYPEAKSMILAEYGDLKFIYSNEDGFKYEMSVAVRKKIFDITDADQGNIKLRVYHPIRGSSREDISSLKAYSYNLVGNKIQKEKLSGNEYFETRLNDYWVEFSFAIPNIQSGSVIEYSYTKTSEFLNSLSTWVFQSNVPTAHSEFRFTIPEFYNYQISQVGNVSFGEKETKNVNESFTYNWRSDPQRGGKVETGTSTIESNSRWQRLVMKNIVPVENEPYMNNKSDVPGRLEFQLVSTKFPNKPVKYVAGNYIKFNEELLSHSAFGDRLDKGSFAKDLIEELPSKSDLEKATGIYTHIANHFDWNEFNNFLSAEAGKQAYNNKNGNIADINLSLIAALREANIKVNPIILSTRGHGIVHPVYPSYQDFNYVIGALEIDGKLLFADASSRLPIGQLPLKCRNGKGWLVDEAGGKWIDLKQGAVYSELSMLNTEFDGTELVTHVSQKESGYAAFNVNRDLLRISKDEFAKKIATKFDEVELENFSVDDPVSISQPASLKYDIVRSIDDAHVIYLQPIMLGSITSNPFKRAERFSPIDFPYSQSYKVISQITIPDGYKAELPEPALVKLPDGQGTFTFNLSQAGNTINVISDVKINKTDFSINDYPLLKQFYQIVAEKNQEMIVLKK